MSKDRNLKVRSVNDAEQENWQLADDVNPMVYCAERGEEGWELVNIVDGLGRWSGVRSMSERRFTLMLVFKPPLE